MLKVIFVSDFSNTQWNLLRIKTFLNENLLKGEVSKGPVKRIQLLLISSSRFQPAPRHRLQEFSALFWWGKEEGGRWGWGAALSYLMGRAELSGRCRDAAN